MNRFQFWFSYHHNRSHFDAFIAIQNAHIFAEFLSAYLPIWWRMRCSMQYLQHCLQYPTTEYAFCNSEHEFDEMSVTCGWSTDESYILLTPTRSSSSCRSTIHKTVANCAWNFSGFLGRLTGGSGQDLEPLRALALAICDNRTLCAHSDYYYLYRTLTRLRISH